MKKNKFEDTNPNSAGSNEKFSSLWNPRRAEFEIPESEFRKSLILEQYKIYIATAEATSQRRLQMNGFFLTLTTAVLAALSYTLSGSNSKTTACIVVIGGLLGVVITRIWSVLLNSYRRINSGKFTVIGWIEQELPASPMWNAEWELINPESLSGYNYIPLSKVESKVPIVVAFAFFLITCLGISLLFTAPVDAPPQKIEISPIELINP